MTYEVVQVTLADGKVITLEAGKLAKQAAGSVVVKLGETVVLVTVCHGAESQGDFFPLTVEYREKFYAAGKIPGGYIKREARPSDKEVLTSRLIDRPLRPMFPEGYRREVQVVATVLSADDKFDSDAISIIGASAAMGLSPLPFEEQVAAVKVVGSRDGGFIVYPTYEEAEVADIELIVAGTETSVNMVEGAAFEVSEEVMVNAILAGHEAIKAIIQGQKELIRRINPQKEAFAAKARDMALAKRVEKAALQPLRDALHTPLLKKEHYKAVGKVREGVQAALAQEFPEREAEIAFEFEEVYWREMREMILKEGVRIDGRKPDQVRDIDIETQVLPRTHGSAIFQRGETQALVVCTLGTKSDEQRVESLQGETFKNYMLHYNFPPFSVGEVKRMGLGRREVGHGFLAERALSPILPTSDSFPYTIRLVSDILESHGSSSMASVCGGTLALMDAGVKIKDPVAGIAMGLVSDGGRLQILSDINGTEDHLGDMDFKICGTAEGITSFQMDIKLRGITPETMHRALEQARAGRLHILQKMHEALSSPRELSKYAPSILQKKIPPDRVKDIIGPGGKVIRGIQDSSGANLNVDDTGLLIISAPHRSNALIALKMVNELFAEAEVGKVYRGKVKGIATFGAFVEILPGKEGLVHISELAPQKVDKVEDVLSMGDEVEVKCIAVDPQGKIKLSRKAALAS